MIRTLQHLYLLKRSFAVDKAHPGAVRGISGQSLRGSRYGKKGAAIADPGINVDFGIIVGSPTEWLAVSQFSLVRSASRQFLGQRRRDVGTLA
jgi:hypothetical protein